MLRCFLNFIKKKQNKKTSLNLTPDRCITNTIFLTKLPTVTSYSMCHFTLQKVLEFLNAAKVVQDDILIRDTLKTLFVHINLRPI